MRSRASSLAASCLLLLDGAMHGAVVARGPFLQAAGQSRITICWRTDVATTTEVRYSSSLPGPMASVQIPGTRTEHVVDLSELEPDRRYFYSLHGTSASGTAIQVGGANHWFRTAPEDLTSRTARFWVVGDSGYQFAGPMANFNAYMALTASAGKLTEGLLMLGDNAYDIGTESQIQAAVFNRYASLLRNTPLWSAFGNHDAYSVPHPFTALTPYDTSFYFPTAGQSGGHPSGSVRYYSFDHGDIHFISLDTFTPVNALDAPGGPHGMVDWLIEDLRKCEARWIVAFMHLGPYSKGSHDTDTEGKDVRRHIIPTLEEYGVDLVLAGHSHVYERSRLIDGHYGTSSTWNQASMLIQDGNGSDLGGVSSAGVFEPGTGTGPYRKPAAAGRAGAVYLVCGASSAQQGWWGGSTALVSPNPHPVHVTSLNLLGSVVLEVGQNRMNGRYLDISGAIRDDFTLLKGSTYSLHSMSPAFSDPDVRGASFVITREGALLAEAIELSFVNESGDSVQFIPVVFASGQSLASITIPAPAGSIAGKRYKLRINPSKRPVVPGAPPRDLLSIEIGTREVEFASSPSDSWFATWFPGRIPSPADWLGDNDGDGRSELIEYGFGGDPTQADAIPGYRIKVEGTMVVLRFIKPYGRSDLTYHVEQSGDTKNWTRDARTPLNDGPPSVIGERFKIEIPISDTCGFLRLAVEMNHK